MKWKTRYDLPKIGDIVELIDPQCALIVCGIGVLTAMSKGKISEITHISKKGHYLFGGTLAYNSKCFVKVSK